MAEVKGNPALGKTSAINVAKMLQNWDFNALSPDNVRMGKYVCSYFSIDPKSWVENHKMIYKNAVKRVISEVMAQYYVTNDPALVEEVYSAFKTINRDSIDIYSAICCLYSLQNMRNMRDEDDTPLAGLLGNWEKAQFTDAYYSSHDNKYFNFGTVTSVNGYGNMGISNADWANKILDKLQYIYLNPALRNQAEFSFVTTFKMRRDDNTVRFLRFIPYDLFNSFESNPAVNTLEGWVTKLETWATEIENLINSYPYLTEVFNLFGLKGGSDFDFTRDLKGQTLTVYDDFDGAIETAVYAVGLADDTADVDYLDSSDCLFSTPEFVAHFKDNQLNYDDRVFIDITTWSNLNRGSLIGMSIHAIEYVAHKNGDPVSKLIVFLPCYPALGVEETGDATADELTEVLRVSQYLAMLDPVIVCGTTKMYKAANQWNVVIEAAPGLADYVMQVGDYEPVLAQASFDVLFSNCNVEKLATYKTISINSPATGNYTKE